MYLNTHTYYSFKYGTLATEELLSFAQQNGVTEMALTDINSTAGCLNFSRLAPQYDVKPILGIDFRNGTEQKFVGIARNNEGFQELNAYLSQHLHEEKAFPDEAPAFEHAFVVYPFDSSLTREELGANEYVGVRPQEVVRLPRSRWQAQQDKLVILQTVSFKQAKIDFNMHRLLRAIDKNTLLSKLPKREEGKPSDVMYSVGQLFEYYKEYPQIIVNTKRLLEQCDIQFVFNDPTRHQNLKTYSGSEEEDVRLITRLCHEGLPYRYGEDPGEEILNRLDKELELIQSKSFVSYFLVNWDILKYAREQGYYYVGRGSGANSIVAYLLRVTDVDPIELDLYFERFINLFRQNPPDFDIDFSWRDRDDITRYIFERFGKSDEGLKVALLATYSTFQYRSTIRELGKVFGLPPHEIEKISEKSETELDHIGQLILRYSNRIKGFPSHLSIHAGGVIISDRPIHHFTATSLPPKGYPITHFDMIVAEDVGLFKFDILSQRGLGKIKDSLAIIAKNCPDDAPVDIHDFKRFKTDPLIADRLRNADAIGCFYIESPAMRMLMMKLQVDEYLGLVAASSIIRPGVSKSGMMRKYILRYRYPERRKEAHPVLQDIMPDTYGVMVYQEDVIKVAHYFAKLTLGEADVLRRGMSGKYRSREEFMKVKGKFFSNCKDLGYPDEQSADIWRQIESFAGYAFAKGHSASYAVESYQALYLKTYYPLEYMVAVINNGGGFYRPELYVHEARMGGAQIEAPCVNNSEILTVIFGRTIYLGFGMVKDLDQRAIDQILQEREKRGLFLDLDDFITRVHLSLEQLKLLVRVGALRFTEMSKKELLWQLHFVRGAGVPVQHKHSLFELPIKQWSLPSLHHDVREDAFDEMDLLGFPLCNPFELLAEEVGGTLHRQLAKEVNQRVTVYGYLISIKNTGTSRGERMNFGTFIDAEGKFIDTVHFPNSAAKFPFRGRGIYRLEGKVVEEFDFFSVEVDRMEKMNYVNLEDVLDQQALLFTIEGKEGDEVH